MEYTKEQRYEIFKKLPEPLQDAILSIENAEILTEIGNKFKLLLDKRRELGDETGLVLLGIVSPSDFTNHIVKRLEVDQSTANAIANEINEKIFLAIREYLKNYKTSEKVDEPHNPPQSQTIVTKPEQKPTPPPVPQPKEAMPEALLRAMDYEKSKLPKESRGALLHAIENPHTIKLDSSHSWFPPMATHGGLPEEAPEHELSLKEGETVHEIEPPTATFNVPINKIVTNAVPLPPQEELKKEIEIKPKEETVQIKETPPSPPQTPVATPTPQPRIDPYREPY